MDRSDKPLRLFLNPFGLWTDFALKTGEAMLASAQAAAARAQPPTQAPTQAATQAPKIAVIPTADAPPPKPMAPARKASKAARFKSARARIRSKANAKRRARR